MEMGGPVLRTSRPDVSQLFGGRAPRQHLRFKASNDFAVETAMVDAGRCLQALVHLVGNALESQVGSIIQTFSDPQRVDKIGKSVTRLALHSTVLAMR